MSVEEKAEKIKVYLKENGFSYEENVERNGIILPILLNGTNIVIHPYDNQLFYEKVKHGYKPVFIRETESIDFIIEKVENTIISRMESLQKKFEKENEKKQKRNSR